MTDRVGQQLGNYRLVRLLGRGGFAEVYLGQHLRLNMQAAIKVLHTQLADAVDIQNFHREAQTIASLIHPHIVRVLDFDVKDGVPFLVMDYAPNGSLRYRHPKGVPLPLPTIVSYVKQVADALQYAHNQKLIHCDVKPENMLLGRRNEVLLSDFGTAIIAQSSRYQGTQDMVGTIAYMAPEQIQAHPRPASDQYALGVVVYEWLCGEYPFQGSFSEIAAKHTMMPPPSLRRKVPTLSPELEQVVMAALAKDPRQRFANVQGFAAALEQASLGAQMIVPASTPMMQFLQASAKTSLVIKGPQPVATDPSMTPPIQPDAKASPPGRMAQAPVTMTPPGQSRRQVSTANALSRARLHHQEVSRRTIVLGLGVAGLAVAGGGFAWLTLLLSSAPGLTPTPIPLGTLLYTYRGHSDYVHAVAWSSDGTRIASGSDDQTVQVWDAADGSNVFTYRGHSDAVETVAWSHDDKHIASAGNDQTVQVWDAVDGEHVFTYRGHTDLVDAVVWSPDSAHIASGSWDRTVQVWDAANGGNVFTYRGHSGMVTAVAWSPDGTRIASGSDDQTVQVWDAANGGNVFTYRGHSGMVTAVAWSPDGTRIASASNDQTVQVWDAADGGHVYTYRGHSDPYFGVLALAWSPDGTRIASGCWDKTVQVWDAGDGSHVFTYRGHTKLVTAVAWSPDGTRIASGSSDHTVQVWGVG
jgi:serine/threonine protein kinase